MYFRFIDAVLGALSHLDPVTFFQKVFRFLRNHWVPFCFSTCVTISNIIFLSVTTKLKSIMIVIRKLPRYDLKGFYNQTCVAHLLQVHWRQPVEIGCSQLQTDARSVLAPEPGAILGRSGAPLDRREQFVAACLGERERERDVQQVLPRKKRKSEREECMNNDFV